MGTLLLDVGGRDNLSGEVEPLTEVVKTLYQNQSDNPSYAFIFINGTYLGGEGVVVVLPGELGLDVAAGDQGLAGLDHVEVLGVNVAMLGKVEVLLGHEHTLYCQPSATLIHLSSIIHRSTLAQQFGDTRPVDHRCSHTAEEVLVDLLAVFLGDKPGSGLATLSYMISMADIRCITYIVASS